MSAVNFKIIPAIKSCLENPYRIVDDFLHLHKMRLHYIRTHLEPQTKDAS